MVEKYKKDYPEEYKEFLALMDRRREQLGDKRLGNIQGTSEMRNAVSIPDRLFNLMSYVFNGVSEEKFLEPKGEMKWFVKKFPEFLIPRSY